MKRCSKSALYICHNHVKLIFTKEDRRIYQTNMVMTDRGETAQLPLNEMANVVTSFPSMQIRMWRVCVEMSMHV